MNQIAILGAGPAACLLAIALGRQGLEPLLIGQPRTTPAVEGLSQRVVDALGQLGCREALALLGPRWGRVSSWNGRTAEMNGEFAVERVAFDQALLGDVRAAGVPVREGRVRGLERAAEGGWRIAWEDREGSAQQARAALAVECRGHTAPKTAPDLHAGATLVSIARSFEGARPQPGTTLIESFSAGWAWGGVDRWGRAHVQVVVLPETVAALGGELDAVHARCMADLKLLPERIGGVPVPCGPAHARGIQAALRGGCAAADYLRVGDAAYSGDPLSGHGLFEAASGAIAAVAVINTLLREPGRAALALRYFRERCESVFWSRVEAARTHYASETRWSEAPFWRRMAAPLPSSAPHRAGEGEAARFALVPVVENGFVVERRVVVGGDHPRGVRFIDGVDLGRLDEALRAGPHPGLAELSRRLDAPPLAVGHALRWLQTRRLIPRVAHRARHELHLERGATTT